MVIPLYSLTFPNLPYKSLGFPRYPRPLEHGPPLRILEVMGWSDKHRGPVTLRWLELRSRGAGGPMSKKILEWCVFLLFGWTNLAVSTGITQLYIHIYVPGTQMTSVLIGKDLVLEGSTPKIEDKQVPGIYIYICCIYIYVGTWLQK